MERDGYKKMNSRRDFLKKATYVAPAVLSFKAVPSFANTGSVRTQSPFIDLGAGCEHETYGIGDGEMIRDRHSLCR